MDSVISRGGPAHPTWRGARQSNGGSGLLFSLSLVVTSNHICRKHSRRGPGVPPLPPADEPQAMAAARAPARATWPQKLAEAQRLGAEGARLEFAKDYTASFEAYVRAGELYLWLWRTYDAHGLADSSGSASRTSDLPGSGADLKGRLQKAAQKVLDRAELIKMVRSEIKPLQRRPLSDEEQQRALVAGGRLVSVQLSEWGDDDGSPSKYAGTTPYESPRQPSLARLHMEQKATYISPRNSERWRTADLFREQMKGSDIVQDIITDCSFVAGLIVAREHDVKWGTSVRLVHCT